MMTCGRCGHKYIGDDNRYVSYAHRRPTVMYGRALARVRRCQSPSVGPADRIEAEIWAGAEDAIRNPGPTLAKLHAKLTGQADASETIRAQLADK